jgi:predicted O-methyltransferase YrrM
MTQELWTGVDRYLEDLLLPQDPVLEAAVRSGAAAGFPMDQVSPSQGRLLFLLAKAVAARNILEIGTLAGYSAIWMARALPPGGRLLTLESDPQHVEIARANIGRAGLESLLEVRLGPALDSLPQVAAEGRGPFDLAFIDADKQSNPEYFQWALHLARRGGLIVVDNIVRGGAVADGGNADAAVQGTRRFLEMAAAEPKVCAAAFQTVGRKGYDGMAILLVTADP